MSDTDQNGNEIHRNRSIFFMYSPDSVEFTFEDEIKYFADIVFRGWAVPLLPVNEDESQPAVRWLAGRKVTRVKRGTLNFLLEMF